MIKNSTGESLFKSLKRETKPTRQIATLFGVYLASNEVQQLIINYQTGCARVWQPDCQRRKVTNFSVEMFL